MTLKWIQIYTYLDGKWGDMGDGKRVWAHLVGSCQKECSWVFKWAWLSKWGQLGCQNRVSSVVEMDAVGLLNGHSC